MAKKKSEIAGTFSGKKIPAHVKKSVIDLVAAGQAKTDVARSLNISLRSVYSILGTKSPDKLREQRREKMVELQDKAANIARVAMDMITPDKLQESSPSQLAVIAGINMDKVEKFDRRITENEQEEKSQDLDMVPDKLEPLLGAIRNMLREFDPSLLGVKFAGERTIKEEVSDLEQKLGSKIVEAEVETLEGFYGRDTGSGGSDSSGVGSGDHEDSGAGQRQD